MKTYISKNKFIILLLIIFPFLWLSCATHKYEENNNYKPFYIVDTIQISDPVVIVSGAKLFLTSERLLLRTKVDANFFRTPGVYLMLENFFSSLETEKKTKELFPVFYQPTFYSLSRIGEANGKLMILKYPKEIHSFVLGLVRVDYLNRIYKKSKQYPFKVKDDRFYYLKIVNPLIKK